MATYTHTEEELRLIFVLVGCSAAVAAGLMIMWGVSVSGGELPDASLPRRVAKRVSARHLARLPMTPHGCEGALLRRLWGAFEYDSDDLHYSKVV